jgi:hypothetical protein
MAMDGCWTEWQWMDVGHNSDDHLTEQLNEIKQIAIVINYDGMNCDVMTDDATNGVAIDMSLRT